MRDDGKEVDAPMTLDRRAFLARTSAAIAGTAAAGAVPLRGFASDPEATRPDFDPSSWQSVREQFPVAGADGIDLSALLVASHPHVVRDAIAEHRRALDLRPTLELQRENRRRTRRTLDAAARYLGAPADEIALTDSTTMGLGLVYTGLDLAPGDELLTTAHDYYVTHESLRFAAERTGAEVRRIDLYDDDPSGIDGGWIVDRIASEIRPETRVVALTWVHSDTGLELPLARIADAVREVADRRGFEPPLLCVDAVHGFGIEDVTVDELGFDVVIAGCHKWLFGPRGTGVVWARPEAWRRTRPTIPSFLDGGAWNAWQRGESPSGPYTARRNTPGGFKPFEHVWALAEAFAFHQAIGKERVAARTHELAMRTMTGLAEMSHVRLTTPLDAGLSAGIVAFDVAGMSPRTVVRRLRDEGIVATVAPYAVRHVRLTPSVRNLPWEIDEALVAVASLAPSPVLERGA